MTLLIFIVSVGLLVVIDQYSKILAVEYLMNKPSIPIIKDVFELSYTTNEGAAFGMLQGHRWFFIIITGLILIAIIYYYFTDLKDKKYVYLRICFILIAAGALGNLIDRVVRGYVIDYFYLKLIDFPIFNLADTFVVVGTILFAILMLTKYKEDMINQ